MQREMQSSKCGCSHLPVQVITGILKVSKEGDRAESLGSSSRVRGGNRLSLSALEGTEIMSEAAPELGANIISLKVYGS